MQGVIDKLDKDKGYGFIASGTDRYFFHRKDLKGGRRFNELRVGDSVEFEDCETDKGLRAEDVWVV